MTRLFLDVDFQIEFLWRAAHFDRCGDETLSAKEGPMTMLIMTGRWLRTATHSLGRMFAARVDALAEARIHSTAIELELHRGWFGHAS
jgi:hypothetical protein